MEGDARAQTRLKGALLRGANRALGATGLELRSKLPAVAAPNGDHRWIDPPPFTDPPSDASVRAALDKYRNEFPIASTCTLTGSEIDEKIASYYWHYPFVFGDRVVEASFAPGRGTKIRDYKRFVHFMPTVLEQLGGSFKGMNVLDLGCNCGYWSIQARLLGADHVLGVEGGSDNVEQGRFILDLIGLDGIDYRVGDATKVTREDVGEFDVTFLFGLLYHVSEPVTLIQALYDVTKNLAVVDTSVVPDDSVFLDIRGDEIHNQNFGNNVSVWPSRGAVTFMLKSVGFKKVLQIPLWNRDLPPDYLQGRRVTYLAFK
jgi:SAM-dependent methyltransferase